VEGPLEIDPATEEVLMEFDQPGRWHNGGQVSFGPEEGPGGRRYLYLSFGDGSGPWDPFRHAQDRSTIFGTVVRIDVDGPADDGLAYAIPSDNPFAGNDHGWREEIWAYGLRNPWRYSFDRETGELWIGDVGQNAWEEIDVQPSGSSGGENYGWNRMEGDHPYGDADPPARAVRPVFEYSHDDGGCTVAGGYVYRGESIPDLYGAYLFADYCLGSLEALRVRDGRVVDHRVLGPVVSNLSSFGQDARGELYAMSLDGPLYRLAPGP
jgi:glucose/arabinose dehydrogenase